MGKPAKFVVRTATVTVFARPDLEAEIADLTLQIAQAPSEAEMDRRKALRDARLAEMGDSALTITLKSLTRTEMHALAASDASDDVDQIVAQVVSPEWSADEWRDVLDSMDWPQWSAVWDAANDLLVRRAVMPDFSRGRSFAALTG